MLISLFSVPTVPNLKALTWKMASGITKMQKSTRTTRTPAFWGYTPPPHDYPHYWVILDPWFSKSRSNDLEDIGQGQRSSHATHHLMVVIICGKYGNNRSRTENVTERTRFSKSRSNDLEDVGQGQRSSHATHLLVVVIICTKYGKKPSRTVDATERTWFSRPRPNDLEDIGQGQRSLYATHPLILVIICAKYGKNPSRTVDFIFKIKLENFQKFAKNSNFLFWKKKKKRNTRHTL